MQSVAVLMIVQKKNEVYVNHYKQLLESGPNMIELPANLTGLLRMKDVSGFHADRYYLGKTQRDLLEKIKRGVAVTLKLNLHRKNALDYM